MNSLSTTILIFAAAIICLIVASILHGWYQDVFQEDDPKYIPADPTLLNELRMRAEFEDSCNFDPVPQTPENRVRDVA